MIVLSDVFVGIAGQHIKSIRNRGYINRDSYDDEITNDDIDALIKDMYKIPIDIGEEIIHVLPQNYIVDNEGGVKNPVGMSGKRVEGNFQIVIGQVASARNISRCIDKAGLRNKAKIMIGGGQIDDSIKDYVGADAYGKDALEAVALAKKWAGVA